MNSHHADDMPTQNLNAQVAQSKEDKNSKAEDKARSKSETQWNCSHIRRTVSTLCFPRLAWLAALIYSEQSRNPRYLGTPQRISSEKVWSISRTAHTPFHSSDHIFLSICAGTRQHAVVTSQPYHNTLAPPFLIASASQSECIGNGK